MGLSCWTGLRKGVQGRTFLINDSDSGQFSLKEHGYWQPLRERYVCVFFAKIWVNFVSPPHGRDDAIFHQTLYSFPSVLIFQPSSQLCGDKWLSSGPGNVALSLLIPVRLPPSSRTLPPGVLTVSTDREEAPWPWEMMETLEKEA